MRILLLIGLFTFTGVLGFAEGELAQFAGMPQTSLSDSFKSWKFINCVTSGSIHSKNEQSMVGSASFVVNPSSWVKDADLAVETFRKSLAVAGWKVGESAGTGSVQSTFTTRMMFDSRRGENHLYTVIVVVPERGGVVTVVWHQILWEHDM